MTNILTQKRMKNVCRFILSLFLLAPALSLGQERGIREAKFVRLGGIEQWITIESEDRNNPVILFLHGGPGSTMTPYEDVMYGKWTKEFTLVKWDQRGAGRTYGRNAPEGAGEDYWIENPLTVAQMTADGIELSEYLVKTLGKGKIILVGTSWGSVLGARMALARPELFLAYVGHSQIVNAAEGFQTAYASVNRLAREAGDTESLEELAALGPPPYGDARKDGQLMRIIKKYERLRSTPAPESWWKLAPEYENEKDERDRASGDDYSFLHYAGHQKMGVRPMSGGINFMEDGLNFKVPVYLIQGEVDILTPKELTRQYFEAIRAPKKQYLLVPGAAHGHNQAIVDAQYRTVKELAAD